MHLFITPHPPIILPEIGQGEERPARATIGGMKNVALKIAELKPKTIAIVSPHGHAFSDALCISVSPRLSGDFGSFGYSRISLSFPASDKAKDYCDHLEAAGIQALALDKSSAKEYRIATSLDHGALVPLYFVNKEYPKFELLHIGMGFLTKEQTCAAGKILADLLDENDVIIFSGDLSHRLTHEAPAGYDEQGAVYDHLVLDAIKNKNYMEILSISDSLLDHAGQCAQRPLEMLIGALDGYATQTEVYSYQGPYGVGYLTAHIERLDTRVPSIVDEFIGHQRTQMKKARANEDDYVALARQTIEAYVTSEQIIAPPKGLSPELYTEQNGVFVSIKKAGNLRGCIGTIESVQSCIAEEIIRNAISAATRDPRFAPIMPAELDALVISVDILYPPEDIDGPSALDPKEYGVIVSKGHRRGLLLPNLEGIDSVAEQVDIALKKAGIGPNERYSLQRFKVVRHT